MLSKLLVLHLIFGYGVQGLAPDVGNMDCLWGPNISCDSKWLYLSLCFRVFFRALGKGRLLLSLLFFDALRCVFVGQL